MDRATLIKEIRDQAEAAYRSINAGRLDQAMAELRGAITIIESAKLDTSFERAALRSFAVPKATPYHQIAASLDQAARSADMADAKSTVEALAASFKIVANPRLRPDVCVLVDPISGEIVGQLTNLGSDSKTKQP